MSSFKASPEFLRGLRELAVRWGKIAAERASDEVGANQRMDFSDMEQFAAVVAAGLSEGMMTTLLDKEAKTLANDEPCPKCGTCSRVNYHDRPLTLETGQVLPLHEPICHCPKCHRDFFPPPDIASPGRPQLQPQRLEEDR
jgi:hypothetical protein